jgi:hypothetical protein
MLSVAAPHTIWGTPSSQQRCGNMERWVASNGPNPPIVQGLSRILGSIRWRKSLHFHFLFDLRHWSYDLAFANNSSYQEHWLADFPDTYLREPLPPRESKRMAEPGLFELSPFLLVIIKPEKLRNK